MSEIENYRVANGDSGRSLEAVILKAGDDLLIKITGGARPHIGTVVLARPDGADGVCTEAMTIPPHKEEMPAREIARRLSAACHRTVVVTAGIHEDELDAQGICEYLELADRMAAELGKLLRQ